MARVPLTRKESLSSRPVADRISCVYKMGELTRHLTGGTTGKSLEIYCDPAYEDIRVASIFRAYAYHGYRPTDRIAVFMFNPVPSRLINKLGLFRRVGFPFEMGVAEVVDQLVANNFEIFEGYPSRLRSVAAEVLARRITSIRPKAVIASSEMLDAPVRLLIEQAFGVAPVDVYESWECSQIAWEGSLRTGMHINADLKVVEVCDDQGNAVFDTPGEIVITDLYNKAMPFIRYCTGDRGILQTDKCACGSSLPVLKCILGRVNDSLVLKDGQESVSITPLFVCVKGTKGIIEHQAVQERPGELVIVVVCNEEFTNEIETDMKRRIAAMYALERIEVRRVPAIERTGVGKLRAFISKLDRK